MNNVTHSDDEIVLEQSFSRNTQPVIQNGYADGLADGRETVYQKDFDRGYRTGFSMAFKLSQYEGFAVGLQKQSDQEDLARNITQDLIFRQEPARAHCLLCRDKTMEKNPLDNVESLQKSHNDGVLKVLGERYRIS